MYELNLSQGAVFGDAVFLSIFEDDSPKWHEIRSQGIGGSDVAPICGVSKWTSAYSLWAKKCGLVSDERSENEAMEWGKILEPIIAERFKAKHPELTVHTKVGSWASVERPWQIVNPDGLYQKSDGEWGILEIKTARYEDDWALGVPTYYRTQVQWYLQAFGLKEAIVAVLFGGNKSEEYYVYADEFEQSINLAQVERFMECWKNQTPPDWDGSASTFETVRNMHPDIRDVEVDLGEAGYELMVAAAEYDYANEKFTAAKSKVMSIMGDAKTGVMVDNDGKSVKIATRSSRNGGAPFLKVSKYV